VTPETLPCLCCGKNLTNYMAGEGLQPNDGLHFSTGGHYGSAFFDPMNGERLDIMVCDECLERHKDRAFMSREVSPQRREWDIRPYDPNGFAEPELIELLR
jgi:hypothetical protein